MSSAIPLIRAGIVDTIVNFASGAGVPVRRYLKSSRLPDLPWGEEDPLLAVPLASAMDFMELVARKEGCLLFGIDAASQVSIGAVRSLHLDLQDCANLHQVLRRFIQRARLQSTAAEYYLQYQGELAWFCHRGRFPRARPLQTDLFTVTWMIDVVRMVAGPKWTPLEIQLTARAVPQVQESEFLGTDRITFEQERLGIAIPRALLARKKPTIPFPLPEGLPIPEPLPEKRYSSRLRALLPAYLSTPGLDTGLIAGITGMSFRTLQRHLAGEGTSYSKVLADARRQVAEQLLGEGVKPGEISRLLGYGNPSNFTRAFRNWTGVSPREYIRLLREGARVAIATGPVKTG